MGWDLSDDGLLIAGLVAFSLPLSVFITQVYHAYNRKMGFKNLPYIEIIREQGKKDWKQFSSDPYVLDARLDFVTLKHNHEGDLKECLNLIRRHAQSYNLSIMLAWTSFSFAIGYGIFIFRVCHLCANQSVWPTILIVFSLLLSFLFYWSSSEPKEARDKLEKELIVIQKEDILDSSRSKNEVDMKKITNKK